MSIIKINKAANASAYISKTLIYIVTLVLFNSYPFTCFAETSLQLHKQLPLRANNTDFSKYYKVEKNKNYIYLMKKHAGQVDIFTENGWLVRSLYDNKAQWNCEDPGNPGSFHMDLVADDDGVYVAKYCPFYDRAINKLYYDGRVEQIYTTDGSDDDYGPLHQIVNTSEDIFMLHHALSSEVTVSNVTQGKQYKLTEFSSGSTFTASICSKDNYLFAVTSENGNPSNSFVHWINSSGEIEKRDLNINPSYTLRFCTTDEEGLYIYDAVGNIYKHIFSENSTISLGSIGGGFSGQSHLQTDISQDKETGDIYQLKQGLTIHSLDSGFVRQHTVREKGPLDFDRIRSLAVDGDQNIYVSDISGSFQKISKEGEVLSYAELDSYANSILLFQKDGVQYTKLIYPDGYEVFDQNMNSIEASPSLLEISSSTMTDSTEYHIIEGRLYQDEIDISEPSHTSADFLNCTTESDAYEYSEGKLVACNDRTYHWVVSNENNDVFATRSYAIYRKRNGIWTKFDIGEIAHQSGYENAHFNLANGIGPDNEGNFLYIGDDALYKFDLSERVIKKIDSFSLPSLSQNIVFKNGFVFISTLTDIFVYKQIDRPNTSKAIILIGGNESGNTLWNEAQANANHAFLSLASQGYSNANIHYLNHNTSLDSNGNGEPDDVDGLPSLANVRKALTEWAAQAVEGEPIEDVVLYMIGHGGNGTFELGNGEILTAVQLDEWLDELQAIMQGKITVIYDGCQSGSFHPIVGNGSSNRTVITSSQENQNAYFQDAVSFSHLFWNQVFTGKTLDKAFQITLASISLAFPEQTPLMDSDGNGSTNTPEDFSNVSQQVIGNGTVYSGSSPEIGNVYLSPVNEGESTSTITVSEITDDQSVRRAWGIVTPPYADLTQLGTPVQNLPRFNLYKQDDGSYTGSFDGFEQPGSYYVAVYAEDQEGNTSLPVVESFTVTNPLGRKALLVAGVNALGQFSAAIQKQTDHAYNALTGQGYADSDNLNCRIDDSVPDNIGDNVCYLSANTVRASGVDQATSTSGLKHVLEHWAANATSDLVVYLVGDVVDDALRLSATQSVALSDLRQWLDLAQSNIEGTLTIIHEGNGSGASVAAFGDVPSSTKRIAISSSAIGEGSYLPAGGDASFSRYFWGKVAQGGTIEDAFAAGAASLRKYQTPQINANGNAFSNEKSDRQLAKYHDLGLGIWLAANEPVIGKIPLNAELDGGNSSLLWAEQIINLSALERVWAVIEPPEYDPITQQTGELIDVELQLNTQGRWEATYDDFNHSGIYTVHYYAQDTNQRISPPRTSYITQAKGADAYETDDTIDTAAFLSAITEDKQWHNFTTGNDLDYLSFDADPARGIYTIKVDSTNSTADTAFTLYDANGNRIALGAPGSTGEYTIDALFADNVELAYWTPDVAGRYILKVHAAEIPTTASLQDGYTVSIFPTDAPQDSSISGTITNADDAPVEGARLFSDENQIAFSDSEGRYTLKASLGSRSLTVEASGYTDTVKQIAVQEADAPTLDFTLNTPNATDNIKPDPITSTTETPMIQELKATTTHYPTTHTGPIIAQTLQINVSAEGAELHSLTLHSSGQSNEVTEIKAAKVFHDINQNQQVDSADIQIGNTAAFASDNGDIDLTLTTPYLLSQGQQHLMVSYELH